MLKTHYVKEFKYKGKTYKFLKPLKVKIDNFICSDFKTVAGEMSIPEVVDGYTRKEPFNDPEKEINEYLKYVWTEFLFKDNNELDKYELEYKQNWIKLLKPPKQKKS